MMTNRFLHVSLTFRDGPVKTTELEPIFNAFADDWLRYSVNCWIVWSARPASDFLYALKPSLGQNDSVLIVGMNMADRNGWQPKWIWDWLDRKQQLGPPQPPVPPPRDLGNALSRGLLSSSLSPSGGLSGLLGSLPSTKK